MNKEDKYEFVPVTMTEWQSVQTLEGIAEKLGNPTDCSTETGWQMLEALIDFWEAHYPQEVEDWRHDLEVDLETEKELSGLTKTGMYNIAGYPPRLYRLIRLYLPEQSVTDKKFLSKLVNRFALFKTTNLKV